ncbi:MAG: hypothetical protein RLN79_07930 [Cytophagales bacterium]
MKTVISILCVLLSLGSFAQNGVEIIMAHKQFSNNGETIKAEKKSVIWISETKMKISSDDMNEPIMIYDSDEQIITMVMRDKEKYSEISQVEMEEMNAQMEASRKMMEQQMAQMPEAQRAMLQERMAGMFSKEIPKVEYELTEEKVKIGPYSTDKYVGTANDQKIEEVFIASIDQFEVQDSYFNVYTKMMEFMRENMGKMMNTISGENYNTSLSSSYPSIEEGIPVKSIAYNEEFKRSEEILEKISQKEIPTEAFEVPSNFKKIDLLKEMKSGK